MSVDNNEIQSFIANSSVTDELAKVNTIFRWCTNKVQPSIQQQNEIATILDVDVRSLITPTK